MFRQLASALEGSKKAVAILFSLLYLNLKRTSTRPLPPAFIAKIFLLS